MRPATAFACAWKMPFTEVALSPTVTVTAVGFLSPLVALMPTPACAMPEMRRENARGERHFALRVFRSGVARSTREGDASVESVVHRHEEFVQWPESLAPTAAREHSDRREASQPHAPEFL